MAKRKTGTNEKTNRLFQREVNKLAIRAALRAGKDLEFAHYDEPNRFFRGK